MIKKFLLTNLLIGLLVVSANMAKAEDCFIRDDLIPAQYRTNESPTINEKTTSPSENACPIQNNNQCDTTAETNVSDESNTETEVKEIQTPQTVENNNATVEETKEAVYEHVAESDNYEKILFDYFEKADSAVGLTGEAKEKSDQLKEDAINRIIDIKQNIQASKEDIAAIKTASKVEDRAIKMAKISKDITKMEKDITKIINNAQKNYANLLTPEQKKLYKNFMATYNK